MNAKILRMAARFAIASCVVASSVALAYGQSGPGATGGEIKIGNVTPYTGVFAEYGQVARAEAAYFRMVNDEGGVNGRKIDFVSLDSGSNVMSAAA